MIFLTSITVIVFMLLLVITLGRRMTDLLPNNLREIVGFYVAPLLGLAGLILITTVYGWISPFKTTISLFLAIGIILVGIIFEKQRVELFRDWFVISAFALVAAIPILAPAILFDSFNPFNDSFTYLMHGQWLQEHAFSEIARASGNYPAESQIVLYQGAGHRMGGSFFLAFVQSLFHLEWSYYAYLATVGLVFALGSLAIGGVIQQVVPVSKKVVLVLCTLPAFSVNGFIFGAQFGFLPQTFGLAFAAGLACLVPGLIAYTLSAKPAWKSQFIYLLPLALCTSALLITYNDMFVVVGAGIGLFLLLVCWMHWGEKNRVFLSVLILLAQVMTIVNIEGIRIIRNFLDTALGAASGAVQFGWPVLWSPIQFIAHSFGMKSPFDSNVFFIDRFFSAWIFPILLIAIVAILIKILREKSKNLTVLLLICINVIFWLVFIKFRYFTPSLEGQVGYTFLQFKLAKWLAPINLGLLGITIAWLLVNTEKYKRIVKLTMATAFVAGMAVQFVIVAPMFTLQFQDETMQKRSPFNVFLDLRSRVASIPKDQVIYLGIPTEHHKTTQMVAYILSDRKLAGKYEDGYMRGRIPEGERDMPLETADWMIQYKAVSSMDENPLDRVGPFVIRRAPFSFYNLESVTGAYGTETGDNKTWNWVKDSIEYKFHQIGKVQKAKVKFQFLLAGSPRMLNLELHTYSGKRIASFKVPMHGGWGEFESPLIHTDFEDVVIRLTADGEPIRLSASDARETKFLIQNLSFEGEPY